MSTKKEKPPNLYACYTIVILSYYGYSNVNLAMLKLKTINYLESPVSEKSFHLKILKSKLHWCGIEMSYKAFYI